MPGATGATTNEFIELYNPTDTNIDLTGWKLTKKTSGGTETDIVADFPAKTINAKGYLLIAHTDYTGTPSSDISYTDNSIATNNSILLYNASDSLVDKVGMGTATDFEDTAKTNPSSGDSIERKASSTSTSQTLGLGGTEETAGNGEDTDNNSVDFVNRGAPQPQSIMSPVEPLSITPTPSATPTITVTPTSTVTPTISATPTVSVTQTLTPSPTVTLTPTLTSIPTSTPTVTPILTVTMTTTPTPSVAPTMPVSPTVTPKPLGNVIGRFILPNKTIVCRVNFKIRTGHFFIFYMPVVECSPEK